MGPITNYEFGKARHQEIEAEFERYRRQQINETDIPPLQTRRRLIFGLSSILLSAFVIVETLIR